MVFSLDTTLPEAIGPASAKKVERAFGMTTVGEMLAHYPRRYADPAELTPIRDLPVGETVTIVAEVLSSSARAMRNRNGAMTDVIIGDEHGRVSLTFFAKNIQQAQWRANEMRPGRRGVFSGKVGM